MDGVAGAAGTTAEDLYATDYHAWALRQAALLRAGRFDLVDAERVAEELDDVASAQYDKLESALRVLLMHMLKWDHQPARRGRSWINSISIQRRHALRVLRKSPSLKSSREEALAEAYGDARLEASNETGLPPETFPETLPYDWAAITERPFSLD